MPISFYFVLFIDKTASENPPVQSDELRQACVPGHLPSSRHMMSFIPPDTEQKPELQQVQYPHRFDQGTQSGASLQVIAVEPPGTVNVILFS